MYILLYLNVQSKSRRKSVLNKKKGNLFNIQEAVDVITDQNRCSVKI